MTRPVMFPQGEGVRQSPLGELAANVHPTQRMFSGPAGRPRTLYPDGSAIYALRVALDMALALTRAETWTPFEEAPQ